jgi:uncharacterized protein
MKTILVTAAILVEAACAFAQQPAPPLISTTGTAQIRVVPDLADLYFEVETRSADIAAARKEEGERATKILAALRAAEVAEADLKSSQVQISPDYNERGHDAAKLKFYRIWQSISCTIHDLKKVPDITADAVAAGATSVRETSLRTSQLRKYRDEARAKAVQAAKEKAIALANELGAHIGKPYTISEGSGFDWRASSNNASAQNVRTEVSGEDDNLSSTFAPGTISITANVSVSFLLE